MTHYKEETKWTIISNLYLVSIMASTSINVLAERENHIVIYAEYASIVIKLENHILSLLDIMA